MQTQQTENDSGGAPVGWMILILVTWPITLPFLLGSLLGCFFEADSEK